MPWILGASIRHRRLGDEQQVERALAAERELAVATERALEEERLAVARDLHDVVSHNLAAITVHAAAARRRPGGPDPAALTAIEQAGRAALADLRAMLDALAGPGNGAWPRHPDWLTSRRSQLGTVRPTARSRSASTPPSNTRRRACGSRPTALSRRPSRT